MIFHRASGREVKIIGWDPSSELYSVSIVPFEAMGANSEMLVRLNDLKADDGLFEINRAVEKLVLEQGGNENGI